MKRKRSRLRPSDIFSPLSSRVLREAARDTLKSDEDMTAGKELVDKLNEMIDGYYNTTILLALATVFESILIRSLVDDADPDADPDAH